MKEGLQRLIKDAEQCYAQGLAKPITTWLITTLISTGERACCGVGAAYCLHNPSYNSSIKEFVCSHYNLTSNDFYRFESGFDTYNWNAIAEIDRASEAYMAGRALGRKVFGLTPE